MWRVARSFARPVAACVLALPLGAGSPQETREPDPREVAAFQTGLQRYIEERLAGNGEEAERILGDLKRQATIFRDRYEAPSLGRIVAIYAGMEDEAMREDHVANRLLAQAMDARAEGEIGKAERLAQSALETFERIENPDHEAPALRLLGVLAFDRAGYESAAAYAERAREASKKILSRGGQALAQMDFAIARSYLGDRDAASLLDGAVRLARGTGDPLLEADALWRRAELLHNAGDVRGALQGFRDALERAERVGDGLQVARCLLGIGAIYVSEGVDSAALQALKEARRRAEGDAGLLTEIDEYLAQVASIRREHEPALEISRRVLRSLRADAGNPRMERRLTAALVTAGIIAVRAGKESEGRDLLQEGLVAAGEGDPAHRSVANLALGIDARKTGDFHGAEGFLLRAAEEARKPGLQNAEARALGQAALAALERGDLDLAIQRGERAASIAESLLETRATPWGREFLLREGKRLGHEAAIGALLRRGRPADVERAFEWAERGRARALLDDLVRVGVDPSEPLDPKARDERASLGRAYRLLLAAHEATDDPVAKEGFRAQIDETLGELKTLVARTAEKGSRGIPRPATYGQAREFVARTGLSLLLYFVGEESSWLFHLSPEGLRTAPLPPDSELRDLSSRAFRAAMRSGVVPQMVPKFENVSERLADLVLPPKERSALSSRGAVVLPEEAIGLPFECLVVGRDAGGGARYLLEDVPLSYAPSCGVLLESERRNKEAAISPRSQILLAGAPRSTRAPPLRRAEKGLKAAAAAFRDPSAKTLIGADFHKEPFLESFAVADVAIVATHGFRALATTGETRDVGIRFSDEGDDESVLSAREASLLTKTPSLVVLLGCWTGYGMRSVAEGFQGYSNAFSLGGAATLMMSFWPGDDEANARFFEDFLARWREGEGIGSAVRSAKLSLRRSRPWGSPFYWGPFVLIGSPVP